MLIKILLLPPSGPLLISLLGLLLWRWRQRLASMLLIIGTVSGYLCSIPVTAGLLSYSLQTEPVLNEYFLPLHKIGAIVVLGGGLHKDAPEYGDGPTVHERTLGRVRYAAHLAQRTGLPVLAAGGRIKEDQPTEAELMKTILEREFGIGPVLIETRSRNTWENAAYSAAILRRRRIDTILLVTNAAHQPRAIMAFEAHGLNVIPAPTLFFDAQPDWLDPQSWLPSIRAITEIHYGCYEWLGRGWYILRYPKAR
ncbi:MAG: YdcF family protein [Candidatus Competibacteraceae bacterium]|nr:YdcF family protein [Candidatus Competibacteraceae bacterium]HRY15629.1 YdcF family protein [Candidatus Competibacteraceae bacterium]